LKRYLFYWLIALLVVSQTGCQRTTGGDEAHDHGAGGHSHEGPEPLAYTLYGKNVELFVEFKPLVVGSESRFATHLTVLGESFKALDKATVTVSLAVGGRGIRKMIDAPSQPGIFRLALSPVVAGTGRLVFAIQTGTFTDQIVIDNVPVYADEKTMLARQTPEAATGVPEITYLKEQAWQVEFANEPLRAQPFGQVIRTAGRVQSAPSDEALVSAPFDGVVQLANTTLLPGRAVRAGERLVRLTSQSLPNANLDAQLTQARTELGRAKAEYDRALELNKSQLITGNEFERIRAAYESARTAVSALSGSYGDGGKTLTAPIGGYVRELLVRPGQIVTAGQPLVSLTRSRKLVVQADVPPQYVPLLPRIQTATLGTPADGRRYDLGELNGRIVSYGRTTDPTSAYTPLLLEIDNRSSLLPGTLVDVWLKTNPQGASLTVPESALIEEQGTFYVYVQTGGESFQKRAVRLGTRDGMRAELLAGVAAGERVVTKGGYQIRLASLSGTLPAHGHEH
jgi:membrane fusion protein, heavy metal efflux system